MVHSLDAWTVLYMVSVSRINYANLKATIACKLMQALKGKKKKVKTNKYLGWEKPSSWIWALQGGISLFPTTQGIFFFYLTVSSSPAMFVPESAVRRLVLCRPGCGHSASFCDRNTFFFMFLYFNPSPLCKEDLRIWVHDSLEWMVT